MHGQDRDVGTKTSFTVYTLKFSSAQERLEARTDDGFQYIDPTVEECSGEYRKFVNGTILSKAFGTDDLPSVFVWME